MKLRVIELFAGIGAQAAALERMGIEWELVGIVEIDPYCITSYNAIHGTNYKPTDIRKVERLPDKSRSIRAGCDDAGVIVLNGKRCVVRKLTPKECWRLFGFTDEQYEAAKTALERTHYGGKSKASSQLYKQAGNTIVIPMLEAVLSKVKGIVVRIKGGSK